MSGRPWLKITFDPTLPGTALVSNFPKKRQRKVPGQWVVFDKEPIRREGGWTYIPGADKPLFSAPNINDCHKYIEDHSDRAAPVENH